MRLTPMRAVRKSMQLAAAAEPDQQVKHGATCLRQVLTAHLPCMTRLDAVHFVHRRGLQTLRRRVLMQQAAFLGVGVRHQTVCAGQQAARQRGSATRGCDRTQTSSLRFPCPSNRRDSLQARARTPGHNSGRRHVEMELHMPASPGKIAQQPKSRHLPKPDSLPLRLVPELEERQESSVSSRSRFPQPVQLQAGFDSYSCSRC